MSARRGNNLSHHHHAAVAGTGALALFLVCCLSTDAECMSVHTYIHAQHLPNRVSALVAGLGFQTTHHLANNTALFAHLTQKKNKVLFPFCLVFLLCSLYRLILNSKTIDQKSNGCHNIIITRDYENAKAGAFHQSVPTLSAPKRIARFNASSGCKDQPHDETHRLLSG